MVLIAVLFGMTLPITPVQILWVNMVTAVTLSLAIAFEQPEPGLMARRPRDPREPLVNGFMLWRIGFVTVLLVVTSLGMFLWEQSRGLDIETARTAAVNTLVMGQIFYLFNCRSLTRSVFSLGWLSNPAVLIGAGLMIAVQLLFAYAPFMNRLFHTAPIGGESWLRIVAVGLVIFVAVELKKLLRPRRTP